MQQREIKFRVWDKTTNTLNYDSGLMINFGQKIATVYLEKEEYLYNADRSFDEIILSQYTGLKDCEGKEIYEGDIVQLPHLDFREVKWNTVELGWDPFINQIFHESSIKMWKIITNIYENPDLLK